MTANVLDRDCAVDEDDIDIQKDTLKAEAFELNLGVSWIN